MGTKGENTRETILNAAQDLVLQHGFSGASLDDIIQQAGITKGGFFYHFRNRNELARELLVRFLEEDDRILNDVINKACSYVDDPLQRLLIALKMYAEIIENMETVHPGCLVASYTYESQQFDPEIQQLILDGVESWKKNYLKLLVPAAEKYPLKSPFTPESLADLLNTVLEGGIILTKVHKSNAILIEQMKSYEAIVRFAFQG